MGGRRPGGRTSRVAALALTLLLSVAGACAPGQAGDSQSRQVAELQARLAAQETRIAGLQAQNTALPTAVARLGAAQTPTAVVPVAALPTPLPLVAGLAVSGTSKGVAGAKVTLTAYMDYL